MNLASLGSLPEPLPDNYPCRRAFSFRMNADYFAVVAARGDRVYATRSHTVRAAGGKYIMATGRGDRTRRIIVDVQRSTPTAWHALVYGWSGFLTKTRVRLPRSTWRPAFRVRGITYRPDEPF